MTLAAKPESLPRVMEARAKLRKLASTQKLGKAAGLAAELMLGKKKLSTQEGIATAARRYKVAKPLIEGLLVQVIPSWYLEARQTVDVVIPAPSGLVSLSHSPVLPEYDCPPWESVTASTADSSVPQKSEPSVLDAQAKLQALAVAGHWALAMIYEEGLSKIAATKYAAKRYGVLRVGVDALITQVIPPAYFEHRKLETKTRRIAERKSKAIISDDPGACPATLPAPATPKVVTPAQQLYSTGSLSGRKPLPSVQFAQDRVRALAATFNLADAAALAVWMILEKNFSRAVAKKSAAKKYGVTQVGVDRLVVLVIPAWFFGDRVASAKAPQSAKNSGARMRKLAQLELDKDQARHFLDF